MIIYKIALRSVYVIKSKSGVMGRGRSRLSGDMAEVFDLLRGGAVTSKPVAVTSAGVAGELPNSTHPEARTINLGGSPASQNGERIPNPSELIASIFSPLPDRPGVWDILDCHALSAPFTANKKAKPAYVMVGGVYYDADEVPVAVDCFFLRTTYEYRKTFAEVGLHGNYVLCGDQLFTIPYGYSYFQGTGNLEILPEEYRRKFLWARANAIRSSLPNLTDMLFGAAELIGSAGVVRKGIIFPGKTNLQIPDMSGNRPYVNEPDGLDGIDVNSFWRRIGLRIQSGLRLEH